MAANSPKELCRVIQWVDPDSHATSTDIATLDSAIDTIGFRYALIIVNIGDSAGTWAIQVEASATSGGTYADVTGALFSVGLTDDDTRMVGVIDLQGGVANLNRFLQLNGTSATGIIDLSVTICLFVAHDTEQYIDYAASGADELTFEV